MPEIELSTLLALAKNAIALLPEEEQLKIAEETRQSFATANVALSRPDTVQPEDRDLRAFAVQSAKLQVALSVGGEPVREAIALFVEHMTDEAWKDLTTRLQGIRAYFKAVDLHEVQRYSASNIMWNMDTASGNEFTSEDGEYVRVADVVGMLQSEREVAAFLDAESQTMRELAMANRKKAKEAEKCLTATRKQMAELLASVRNAYHHLTEINMSNYSEDDVSELNSGSILAMTLLKEAMDKIEEQ